MRSYSISLSLLIAFFIATAGTTRAQKNIALKWSPMGLYFGKLTLGSEFQVRKKQSFTFHAGIPVSIRRSFDSNDGNSDLTSKATSLLAGYRLYMGKKEMSGFYFEPYLKYLHSNLEGTFNDTKDIPPTNYTAKSDYSSFGLGAQLGVQFLIGKVIVLDLFLVGPEANTAKVNASFTDISNSIPWTPIDAQEAEDNIRDAIKDIPFIGDKTEVNADQSSKTVFVTYKGFLPGIRTGFSIGFRF